MLDHYSSIRIYQYQGKQYLLPDSLNMTVLFVNVNLFRERGLTLPPTDFRSREWTFDDVVEVGKKLTQRDGDRVTWGFYTSDWIGRWFPFLWGFGGDAMDDTWAPKKWTLDARPSVSTLRLWGCRSRGGRLRRKGSIPPDAARLPAPPYGTVPHGRSPAQRSGGREPPAAAPARRPHPPRPEAPPTARATGSSGWWPAGSGARRGWQLFWRWKSRPRLGRPRLSPEVRELIAAMARDNPRWGCERIRGELLKLGISPSASARASGTGALTARPVLGGLHHAYERAA